MRTDEDAKKSILELVSLYDIRQDHEYLKSGWDEFTSANLRKRQTEIDKLFTGEGDQYINALTMAVVRLSFILKVSRYSIAKAIIEDMKANY